MPFFFFLAEHIENNDFVLDRLLLVQGEEVPGVCYHEIPAGKLHTMQGHLSQLLLNKMRCLIWLNESPWPLGLDLAFTRVPVLVKSKNCFQKK